MQGLACCRVVLLFLACLTFRGLTQVTAPAWAGGGLPQSRGHWEGRANNQASCASDPAFLMWDLEKVPAKLRPLTEDHIRMQQILQESGLNCVYVMPPHIAGLAPGSSGGRELPLPCTQGNRGMGRTLWAPGRLKEALRQMTVHTPNLEANTKSSSWRCKALPA